MRDWHMGQWVRYAREELGMTQAQLALSSKCALRTICRIEAGKNTRLSTLDAVASALTTPLADLLTERAAS
jgi:transcriptional regulator with XRE-family HTH domain